MMNIFHQISVLAAEHKLPLSMVWGIVQVESGGNPWAWNPEPTYRYLWDVRNQRPFRILTITERSSAIPPLDFHSPRGVAADAEWWGQRSSWGPMQIMGAVARERGYVEPFLTNLCNSGVGMEYGCRHLAVLLRKYDGRVPDAVSAYNQGAPRKNPTSGRFINQDYVDRVLEAGAALGTENPKPPARRT